jgi:hypothetical protein
MYVPQVRERVQLAGKSGVFLVMWVDHEPQEADLMPLRGAGWRTVVVVSRLNLARMDCGHVPSIAGIERSSQLFPADGMWAPVSGPSLLKHHTCLQTCLFHLA